MLMAVNIECSWYLLDGTGSEKAVLSRAKTDWVIQGEIVRLMGGTRLEAEYVVVCDINWTTKMARVVVSDGRENRKTDLRRKDGFWFKDGERYPAIDGCLDVDLEWSPSTNTLPIRRLNIPIGAESGLVKAAWIRFPELIVQPLSQTYLRVADDTYLYRSQAGRFEARITVDGQRLVVDYEGFWKRAC
jgi:hypothetical protein